MSYMQIEGNSIHYLEFGSADSPPLVLVHGLYGSSSTVAPLAERFAGRFRVIAPDALGHGRYALPRVFILDDV
jgi:3-oxoadipate enol-lactonase